MKALDPLLTPQAVAVIGASRNPLKVGGSVMANLRASGFSGRIVPVNSRAESVQGFSAVKSVLDGFAAIAFAATLGAGVFLSILTVLTVQGGLATLAYLFGANLDPVAVQAASAVGGVILLGVGLRLLEIRRIRVVSMLPALVLAPTFVALAEMLRS